MKNYQTGIATGIIGLLALLITWGYYLYQSGETVVCQKLDDALKIAAERYLEKEFSKLNMSFAYNPAAHQDKAFKNVAVVDAHGKKIIPIDLEKEHITLFTSSEKKLKYSMIGEFGFISASALDSLWNEELRQRGIFANTTLQIDLLSGTEKTDSKSNQLALLSSCDLMKTYYTGLTNEIQIDYYIDYFFLSIMLHGAWKSVYSMVLLLMMFLLVGFECYLFVAYRFVSVSADERNFLLQVEADVGALAVDENKIALVEEGVFQMNELFFDSNRRKLIKGECVYKIRPQSCDLLLLFSKSENHFLTNQEIIIGLWGERQQGIELRVQRAISDLRKLLQSCSSSIRIEFDVDGYKLLLDALK